MEKKKIIQKIKTSEDSELSKAKRYYSILAAVNNIHLTERELQLIAFTAVRGNISYSINKDEFCKTYNSSNATINNMIHKLKKMGLMLRESGKIKINPMLLLDFKKDLILQISINGKTE